jgi:hypothetical protein
MWRESTDEGVVMKKKRSFAIRLGPLGLSLLAAGITAVAFAAISLADNGNSGSGSDSGNGPETLQLPAPGGKGRAVIGIQGPNLSAADRQKMEEFRQCMEDNGAPAPPDPSAFDPSKAPPKPPSEADQEKLKQAFEACQDKLPRDVQDAGPPGIGTCGPPPGAPAKPGTEQGQQQNQDQSNSQSGTSSSGSSS